MDELLSVANLREKFGCSRQNINYHLTRLTEEFPDLKIVEKINRQNYVTKQGQELLAERIKPSVQTTNKIHRQNDKIFQQTQKQRAAHFTPDYANLEAKLNNAVNRIQEQQQSQLEDLNKKLNKVADHFEELSEDLKEERAYNRELQKQMALQNEKILKLAEQAQTLVSQQQQLKLLEDRPVVSIPAPSRPSIFKRAGLFLKATYEVLRGK